MDQRARVSAEQRKDALPAEPLRFGEAAGVRGRTRRLEDPEDLDPVAQRDRVSR